MTQNPISEKNERIINYKEEINEILGNNKLTILCRAPVECLSGYSSYGNQFIHLLDNINENIDIYLWAVNWGECRMDVLDLEPNNKINKTIKKLLAKPPLTVQPDIFYTITVPQEFERKGRINIGITAGVESDRFPAHWIEKCNEMNLIYMISKFTAIVAQNSIYTKKNNNTGQEEQLRLMKPNGDKLPIDIFSPFVDTDIYKPNLKCNLNLPGLTTDKNFLFVGRWLQGDIGNDRKNIGLLVQTFLRSFVGRKDVGLILKTSHAHESIMDRYMIEKKIKEIKETIPIPKDKEFPKIYLVHGFMSNKEMAQLYNHKSIVSYISPHHGEGWGMPITEAMACNLPCILTPWSGNTDYMIQGNCLPLEMNLSPVPKDSQWGNIFVEGMNWACPKSESIAYAMNWILEHPREAKQIGMNAGRLIKQNHSLEVRQRHVEHLLYNLLSAWMKKVGETEDEFPFEVI